jgi:uncharacterized protein (TIGR02271 family)
MSDSRDTNRDGKVSLMEKVKDKLHLGGHHNSSDFTSSSHHSTTTASSHHTGLNSGHTTGMAAVPVVGVAAMPLASDSRDLNRDGHISTSEKLQSAGVHSSTGFRESDETRLKLHEEQLAISKREVGAGEMGIHKRVEHERVQQTIPVRREEVIVERRPLTGAAEPGARIAEQDEYVRVPLHKEEIVTQKRIVPTEEVIVRKKEVIENQVVGDTLRSEYVETDKMHTGFDARDTNRDGHVSMGEKFQGSHNSTGAFDARDTNRDGHVSMGEKLKGATGATGGTFGDARDTNRDGHVSMGEKLKGGATGGAFGDARDTNRDGHVSMGEKLKGGATGFAAPKAARG